MKESRMSKKLSDLILNKLIKLEMSIMKGDVSSDYSALFTYSFY